MSPAISSSLSGVNTTNGYSTRQSVASVTCETRDRPSNLMLSFCVRLPSTFAALRRNSAILPNSVGEIVDCAARRRHQHFDARGAVVAGGIAMLRQIVLAALLDLVQPMIQRLDQQRAALRIVEQVVLQVRIAAHDPDIAEHFVQHARRAARAAFAAQYVERGPGFVAEQPDHDFAIGKRRVVIGNFAQARFEIERHGGGGAIRIEGLGCVHVRRFGRPAHASRKAQCPTMRVGAQIFE